MWTFSRDSNGMFVLRGKLVVHRPCGPAVGIDGQEVRSWWGKMQKGC